MSIRMPSMLGACAVVALVGAATPALVRAQPSAASGEQPAAPMPTPTPVPAPRRAAVTTSFDMVSAYMFRGIFQEDHGVIAQPLADLGITLMTGEGTLKSVATNVGSWSSVHSGPTSTWYEHDFYAGATFTLGRWKPGAMYTSYASPNDRFNTVHEIAVSLAFDDSAARVPFSPKVLVAFELDGQADGGQGQGTYLEMGVRPSFKLSGSSGISRAIPAKVGLSLRDYYEGANGSDTFGYVDVGLIAGVPLSFLPGGSWDLHGGIDVLFLGTALEAINGGKAVKPVFSIGLGAAF